MAKIPRSDVDAMAIVAYSFVQPFLSMLRAKKILSEPEVNEILNLVLTGLETRLPANDPAVRQARKLVEEIARAGGPGLRSSRQ